MVVFPAGNQGVVRLDPVESNIGEVDVSADMNDRDTNFWFCRDGSLLSDDMMMADTVSKTVSILREVR